MPVTRRALLKGARPLSREWLASHAWIVLGAGLAAGGYNLFIIPHSVVPGGMIGVAQLVNHVTGWPVGLVALAINLPILGLASRIMGPGYGARTVLAMAWVSGFIDAMAHWRGDGAVIPDILVSTIFGGALIGAGIAMIIRGKANAGGTALLAQLLSRLTRVPTGRCMLYIDGVVVLSSVVVLGDVAAASYAIVGIFAVSRSVDAVLNGLDASKAMMIISDRHEQLRTEILDGLDRGGTVLCGRGLFRPDEERQVIFTALSRRESVVLQRRIRDVDPDAFCMVFDAAEVIGSGFRPWR
jgi:uncharacterized membrane-anchored protein YitT (DUF2179 family)